MATVINAGRVAMVPKGEWASATAYTRLDVVLYNGSSWVATADSTGQTPDIGSTYWQLLSLKGEQGEKGDKGDTGATGATGAKGDNGIGFASASSPTIADGTWQITLTNGDTITINLNHTHENMAKLVVCEESDLPSTLDTATIYAQVDDAADPTEIQSLWIAGLEFVGGGGAADYTPKLTSPRNGATIDFDGQSTATIVVKGRNLTSNLSVVVTGDFTVTANGQSVSTIDASNVTDGASVSLLLTKGNDFFGGTIVISSEELEDVTLSITDSSEIVALTGVKFTGTQWLETDYKANPKTEFILKCRLETTSITNVIDNVNRRNWILGGNDAQGCYELYHISKGNGAPYNLNVSLNTLSSSALLSSNANNMLTDPLIIQYSKTDGMLTAGNASISNVTAKTGSNTGNLRICCRLTNGEDVCYSRFYMTIYEFSIIEDGENVRHYIPKRCYGSPGLYDTVTGSFLTSKTNDPLVEVN